jgi:hypothetical protein
MVVLGSRLRVKHLYGDEAPPAVQPQIIGPRHAVAAMLADTLHAAIACKGTRSTEVCLRLGASCCLSFAKAGRSLQFSRTEWLALAGDAAACQRWNAFVDAALEAWQAQGKGRSQAERLSLLKPLLAP